MTLEDPFFVVKDEVSKALNKTRGLYQRCSELREDASSFSKEELEWTSTELRNSLRSVEWDLEDLEDTIAIVEKNPTKFKIDNKELTSWRNFVTQAREEVKGMKEKMNLSRGRDWDRTARQPLLENSPMRQAVVNNHGPSHASTKYTRLENEVDSPSGQFSPAVERGGKDLTTSFKQQERLVQQQDVQIDALNGTVGNLKSMSHQISNELDEQAVMLDDFGNEMENADSKLDSTLKKVAKVLHMSNEKRQWAAIGVLSAAMVLVVVLLFVL